MKLRFFDFEVYPHWWCCTFGDYPGQGLVVNENIKDNFRTITSDMPNCRDLLIQELLEDGVCVSGYNIKGYDLIIANGIYQGFEPELIKCLNDVIINPKLQYSSREHMRVAPFVKRKLKVHAYQELMDDSRSGSLKDNEAVLGLDIRETEVPFDKEDLTEADKVNIIYYNKHDVFSSMWFYEYVTRQYVAGKLLLGKVFGIPEEDCYKKTNAMLTCQVLNAQYTSFPDEYEYRVKLPSKITEYVYDSLPHNLIDTVLNNPYNITGNTVSAKTITTNLYGNTVVFGNGGLHSVLCNNLYVEKDADHVLVNVDVASFYPSILILLNCLSRAVKNPEKFKWIFEQRLHLKFKDNLTQEEKDLVATYKLILNTVFGASGNKYLPIYDRYMCLSTCRIGQVLLASLANNIFKYINNVKIIQANTDGILLYCNKNQHDKVVEICSKFEQVTGMMLEYDYCDKMWQRDVNNYMLIEEGYDGNFDYNLPPRMNKKIKLCGEWLQYTWHRFPFPDVGVQQAFVSSKAAIGYLAKGADVVKSIVSNTNIDDYIIFCKKGPTFREVVQRMADGTEVLLHRANRVIASKNKNLGKLYKVKYRLGNKSYNSMPNTPEHCRLVNEALETLRFEDVKPDIDYMFYVERTADLLDIDWVDTNGKPIDRFKYFN